MGDGMDDVLKIDRPLLVGEVPMLFLYHLYPLTRVTRYYRDIPYLATYLKQT